MLGNLGIAEIATEGESCLNAQRRRLVRNLGWLSLASPVRDALAHAAQRQPAVREFEIVAQESRIGFRYQAAGFGELSARFSRFEGTIRLRDDETDGGAPSGPTAEVTVIIATDSVDTGNPLLDRIVMGASLFDTARFAQALNAEAHTRISRSAFGVAGFAALVRDPIDIDLRIVARRMP